MGLHATIERITRLSRPPANEETAKIQVMVPILADLGWDVHNSEGTGEVLWEHQVGPGTGTGNTGRVDIALVKTGSGGRLVCLIEAKSPGQDLAKHVDQLMRYAFHEGVDICVLTDGFTWWLYLPREAGLAESRRFAELKLRDSAPQQVADDFETFLGKTSLVSGEAEKRAKKVLQARLEVDRIKTEMPRIWQRMLSAPDRELVELLAQRVYDEVGLRPSPEHVAAVLQDKSVLRTSQGPGRKKSGPASGTTQVGGSGSSRKAAQQLSNRPKGAKRPAAVVLWGRTTGLKTWVDVLLVVAEAVYERHPHDFLERTEAMAGRKRPFTSVGQSELSESPREIASTGIFVEANFSAVDMEKKCRRLLELFGYPASDLEILMRE